MASSLTLPPQSPAKNSSQELPTYPIEATSNDKSNKSNDGSGGSNGSTNGALADPAVSAADLTPSVMADVMNVDSGMAPNAEAAAVANSPPPAPSPTLAAPAPVRPAGQSRQSRPARSPVRTPEPQTTLPSRQTANGGDAHQAAAPPASPPSPPSGESSPSTPGHIPPFDWEEFEARYEQALVGMDGEEAELLREFERLVNYFNVWASAASAHDDERAVKRLQTRERYVKIAEQTLSQRKQHLTEVVRAFQSALALLSQT